MIRSNVVLPHPLGPITVTNSLSRTSKSISLSASTPLPLSTVANSLLSPLTRIIWFGCLRSADRNVRRPRSDFPFDRLHGREQCQRFDNDSEHRGEHQVRLHATGKFQQKAPQAACHEKEFDHDHAGNGAAEADPQTGKYGRKGTRDDDPTPDLALVGAEGFRHFDKCRFDAAYARACVDRNEYQGKQDNDKYSGGKT